MPHPNSQPRLQNQVLSHQLRRQDEEISRLKESVSSKCSSERNLRHQILEFRHKVSDLDSKVRWWENAAVEIASAALSSTSSATPQRQQQLQQRELSAASSVSGGLDGEEGGNNNCNSFAGDRLGEVARAVIEGAGLHRRRSGAAGSSQRRSKRKKRKVPPTLDDDNEDDGRDERTMTSTTDMDDDDETDGMDYESGPDLCFNIKPKVGQTGVIVAEAKEEEEVSEAANRLDQVARPSIQFDSPWKDFAHHISVGEVAVIEEERSEQREKQNAEENGTKETKTSDAVEIVVSGENIDGPRASKKAKKGEEVEKLSDSKKENETQIIGSSSTISESPASSSATPSLLSLTTTERSEDSHHALSPDSTFHFESDKPSTHQELFSEETSNPHQPSHSPLTPSSASFTLTATSPITNSLEDPTSGDLDEEAYLRPQNNLDCVIASTDEFDDDDEVDNKDKEKTAAVSGGKPCPFVRAASVRFSHSKMNPTSPFSRASRAKRASKGYAMSTSSVAAKFSSNDNAKAASQQLDIHPNMASNNCDITNNNSYLTNNSAELTNNNDISDKPNAEGGDLEQIGSGTGILESTVVSGRGLSSGGQVLPMESEDEWL